MFYLYAISNHPLKEQLLTTSIANKKKLSESWFYWINRSLTCSEVIWSLKSNASLGFWFEIKCLIGNNKSIWNEHVCLFIFNLLFLYVLLWTRTKLLNMFPDWCINNIHNILKRLLRPQVFQKRDIKLNSNMEKYKPAGA